VIRSYNAGIEGKDLPEMPIAGDMVASELEVLCKDEKKCFHLNNWLNELFLFRQQYLIYKRI
jgi:hypothetical protein